MVSTAVESDIYECTFCHSKVAVNNKHCVLCRSSNRNIISVYCQYEEYRVYHFEQRPILMNDNHFILLSGCKQVVQMAGSLLSYSIYKEEAQPSFF